MSHMPRKKHKLKKKEREREKPGNMQDAQGKNNIIPITYQRQSLVQCQCYLRVLKTNEDNINSLHSIFR